MASTTKERNFIVGCLCRDEDDVILMRLEFGFVAEARPARLIYALLVSLSARSRNLCTFGPHDPVLMNESKDVESDEIVADQIWFRIVHPPIIYDHKTRSVHTLRSRGISQAGIA